MEMPRVMVGLTDETLWLRFSKCSLLLVVFMGSVVVLIIFCITEDVSVTPCLVEIVNYVV